MFKELIICGLAFSFLTGCSIRNGNLDRHEIVLNEGCCNSLLAPTPKKLEYKGATSLTSTFTINCTPELRKAVIPWLKQVLTNDYAWKASVAKNSTIINIANSKINANQEAYTLTISKNKIEISGNTVAAINRGIGRLVYILQSPLTKVKRKGTLDCPALTIEDWPDMTLRGMHIQMQYRRDPVLVRRLVDNLAMLGYNMVVMCVGGSVECSAHPEIIFNRKNGYWKLKELKALADYARSRGLLPIPAINSIGHMSSAPQICPIKNAKGRSIAMNIFHPDFYQLYFDYADAIADAFGNPPYFHIGTDEFYPAVEKLQKLTDKTPDVFYSEFVNKTAAHFAHRNMQTVIWSDMLLEKGKYPNGDTSNGVCGTFQALDKLNKDVIINYWTYNPFSRYYGLDKLLKSGNPIWVSPWIGSDAIYKLCHYAWTQKIYSVLGTTWRIYADAQNALVATAEYSWNASKTTMAVTYDPWDIANILSYRRPEKVIQAKVSTIDFSGGKKIPSALTTSLMRIAPDGILQLCGTDVKLCDAHYLGASPKKILTSTKDIAALAGQKFPELLLCNPADFSDALKITGINKPREKADVILYTRAFGANTDTNEWGYEYIVKNGILDFIDNRRGNALIPVDGYVLSMHNAHGHSEFWLRSVMKQGDHVVLAEPAAVSKSVSAISIPGSIEKGTRHVILFFSKCYPADNTKQLGEVTMTFADGRKNTFPLRALIDEVSWKHDLHNYQKPWCSWIAVQSTGYCRTPTPKYRRIVAVEWAQKSCKDIPASVTFTASPTGIQSGLTLLGGVQF